MKSDKELLNELTWQLDFIIRKLFPASQEEYDDMLSDLQRDKRSER